MKKIALACLLVSLKLALYSQAIVPVTGFGTNPGALNMYKYVPAGITGPAPLVVAMHGCTITAAEYSTWTGWNKLADLHQFYVIYPEQVAANNSSLCFNWFDTTDVNRGVGEALSVKQMIDYMKANYSIDASRIYVTGVSAGGAMTAVMMAAYPDVIADGAIMAGTPYKSATNATAAFTALAGGVTNTPAQWGALVRAQNPGFTGSYPKLAIFHGTADATVNIENATELIKQWTNLNHADQVVDSTNPAFQGNVNVNLTIYNDSSNNTAVYFYKIANMPHGITVDTGACPRQSGATGPYSYEQVNVGSTYWAADFFKLIPGPYAITGAVNVVASASGITYAVPATSGSSFLWSVPPGATVLTGQGTNSITIHFGSQSGYVEVAETPAVGCRKDAAKLYVNVSIAAGVGVEPVSSIRMYYVATENSIHTENLSQAALRTMHLYNLTGQDCAFGFTIQGTTIQLQNSLSRGIYIVGVQDGAHLYTSKIAIF